MAFEPFGYGDRWYDRLGSGKLKPQEFAILLLVVAVLLVAWELS